MAKKKAAKAKKAPPTVQDEPVGQIYVRRLSQVAEFFAVAENTVTRWRRREGYPRIRGRYELREIARWIAGHRESTQQPSQVAELRAERLRMELEKDRGELIEADHVEWAIGWLCSSARAILSEFPDRVVVDLDLKDKEAERVRRTAQKCATEALEALAAIPHAALNRDEDEE